MSRALGVTATIEIQKGFITLKIVLSYSFEVTTSPHPSSLAGIDLSSIPIAFPFSE